MIDIEPQQQAVTMSAVQALQQAIAFQQAGQLQDAEHLYRAILGVQPHHPDANHNLGVLAVTSRQPAAGLPYLKAALDANPDSGQFWLSYIDALIQTSQTDAARQALDQGRQHGLQGPAVDALACRLEALVREPSPPEVMALGAVFNQGQYAEAIALAQAMTLHFPLYGFGWMVLGAAFQQMGRKDEALAHVQRAAALSPSDATAHYNLGVAFQASGRLDEAEASYCRALQFNPDYASAYNNQAVVLKDLARLDEAEGSYRKALQIRPDYAEAHNNLGCLLSDLDRLDEAEASFQRALHLRSDYAEALHNLGNVLKNQSRLDEALENYRLSLEAKCDWSEALLCLTTPFVLLTGMELGSCNSSSRADAGKQAVSLQELLVRAAGRSAPPAVLQASPLLDTRCAEPEGRKNLRIILIYPPPWQIPSPGDPLLGMPFGPPRDRHDHDLDGDFQMITYGLLTIAAQAMRAGYDVSVFNLSTSPWQDVVELIAKSKADVYGISAFTANRRGMGALAALIRQHHPNAHITAGGPFVTALPLETLRYFRDIDTAVIGEGEDTFMELLECLESGRPAVGIPGTAWRNGQGVIIGPTRPRINDLDVLASPFDYFTSHIVMTSRGCPSKCTFCGSFTTWGKKLRFQSAESCLDTFKKALARLDVPFLAIKDDTFTAHRRRTIAICDTIIANKMNFVWSCDTRVDCLDDELLRKMRLAGCQSISLGVESGSPEMLKSMRKETTPEMVLEATRAAQKYGMYVRYYMILLNRGETAETIRQSNDLIKTGRPDRFFFGPLSFFPGTEDWAILSEKHGLTPDIFFKNDFRELTVATNRRKELQDVLLHVVCDIGAIHGFSYTVEEREAVVDRLPNLHCAHLELANAYFRAGRFNEAASALNRAEALGFPIGNIIYNQRACIALACNELASARAFLERAVQSCPHRLVMKNLKKLCAWAAAPVNDRGKPPVLNDSVQSIDYYSLQSHNARLLPM